MLTKVLAVVFAVAIPTVGAFVYIQAGGTCPFSCSEQSACPAAASAAEETPACCETPSRTSCMTLETPSCCEGHESAGSPEVLAIQPREVK